MSEKAEPDFSKKEIRNLIHFGMGWRRGTLSMDNELLQFNGSEYAFVCCIYARVRLAELTGAPNAARGRRIGRIDPEHLGIYEVRGTENWNYLVVREDDTLLLYEKIAEKYPENPCQKHHKDL